MTTSSFERLHRERSELTGVFDSELSPRLLSKSGAGAVRHLNKPESVPTVGFMARLGVRQEAGKEQEVQVPHGEGLANRPDPE